MRNVITRCNRLGPLYTACLPSHPAPSSSASAPSTLVASASTWHRRLGHPGVDVMSKLSHDSSVVCSKRTHDFCYACQLGCHIHLPFVGSNSCADNNFDLRHCDLWTSPIVSVSGYKYFLVILDDYSHFVWTFLLHVESNTFSTLSIFFAYVSTQFDRTIKAVQCDNGCQLDNASSHTFFTTKGVLMWMFCPYTSSQNGKVKHILRTTNNMMSSLLFQTSILACYWVEGLHTATYLLNHLLSKAISMTSP
jgi:hypothetical protein